jgi:hypothetical protein
MPGRRRSRSRSRRKKNKSPSPKSDAGSDFTGQADDDEELGLEGRIALLEVENKTLKAENAELRKKLLEVLKKYSGNSGKETNASSSGRGRDAPKEAKKSRREDDSEAPRREKREEKSSRHEREEKSSRHEAKKKKEEESEPEDGAMPAWASPDGEKQGGAEDEGLNAVLLVNSVMEAYNESVPNNIPLESRLPLVEGKLSRFLDSFGDGVQIIDLKSGGTIIKDRKMFKMRYSCVFRESGAKLKCSTTKRFYYDAQKKPTYCLDFELHESLVTPLPGTKPDGSLGCRQPRTEHLVVLYEEQNSKITRMWLAQDADKLGQDPMAGEEVLKKLPIFKSFEKKIAELKGTDTAGECFFNNYHNIPSVG